MNWNEAETELSLKEWQQILDWRGRDSRLVRISFAWSRWKKHFWNRFKWRMRRQGAPAAGAPIRILFWLPGGMGDACCAKRLVAAYRSLLPDAVFEIYTPLSGVAKMLFGGEKNTHILERENFSPLDYDLALQACMAVKFLYVNPLRLRRAAPAFAAVLERAQKAQKSLGSLLEDLFLTEGLLGRWLYRQGGRRFDLLSYTGGIALPHDVEQGLPVTDVSRKKFGLSDTDYITFHDGTSHAQNVGKDRPTRAWPAECWREFLRLLKKEFPHIQLVQLGGKNSPVYEEADLCLVGRTAVEELPSIMAGALGHVDTESGLVHLAQFLPVRSVVIFGPSDSSFLGYAKNENLVGGDCGGCMWITKDWMLRCPLGNSPAPCMQCVTAPEVLAAVKRILTS